MDCSKSKAARSERQQNAKVDSAALVWITDHPGTGSTASPAKPVLPLWKSNCAYLVNACLGQLDGWLTRLAVRTVQRCAEQGEEDALRAASNAIYAGHPRRCELGRVMPAAADAQRVAWVRADVAGDARLSAQG